MLRSTGEPGVVNLNNMSPMTVVTQAVEQGMGKIQQIVCVRRQKSI